MWEQSNCDPDRTFAVSSPRIHVGGLPLQKPHFERKIGHKDQSPNPDSTGRPRSVFAAHQAVEGMPRKLPVSGVHTRNDTRT